MGGCGIGRFYVGKYFINLGMGIGNVDTKEDGWRSYGKGWRREGS